MTEREKEIREEQEQDSTITLRVAYLLAVIDELRERVKVLEKVRDYETDRIGQVIRQLHTEIDILSDVQGELQADLDAAKEGE